MKKIKALGLSLAVISTLGLVGCGSDSSSGGNSSSSSSLSFPSNAVSAAPTIDNGKKVKEVVAQNQQSAYSINAVSNSGSQNVALTMKKINDFVNKQDYLNTYSLNETVDETDPCLDGGTTHYSGSGNDIDGGTITMTFNQCNEYGTTIDGKIFTTMSNYNSTYDDYAKIDVKYLSDLTVSTTELSAKILKNSTENLEMNFETSTMKMKISAISEINGIKNGQQNAVYYFDLSSSSNISMYQTAGKVFIDDLASYVTYDTSYDMSDTPFVFSGSGLDSGEAHYIMANGGNVKIVSENGAAKTYVDADGDGTYELSEN